MFEKNIIKRKNLFFSSSKPGKILQKRSLEEITNSQNISPKNYRFWKNVKNITNSFIKIVFVFTNRFQKIIAHKMGVWKVLLFLLFNSPKKSSKTEPWRSRSVSLKIVVKNVKNWVIFFKCTFLFLFLLQYFAPVENKFYNGGIHTRS